MVTKEHQDKATLRKRAAMTLRHRALPKSVGNSPASEETVLVLTQGESGELPVQGAEPPDAQRLEYEAAASTLHDQAAQRETASLLFDPDWYRLRYPDVATSNHDPVSHYQQHGAAEGRKPNPFFDTRWYLSAYPDIQGAALNPFIHYLLYGYREGRLPRAPGSEPEPVKQSDNGHRALRSTGNRSLKRP